MFFTDGKLRGLEKFMQLPKYPTKRGGEKYRSSYNYTKGDCKCVNCLHWKKQFGCSQITCPYIQERIDCGACSFDEILHVAFIDVNNKKLQGRINLYVKESKTMDVKFRNDKHKELFYKTIENKYKTNNAFMSAGFADEQFNKVKAIGMSDAQLYKMAGNAVSVPVISVLGEQLKRIYYGGAN